mmetsp:Transcript_46842/g.130447  ORF Transcript_46842/g.130447 Transcript_46842/m.130447 type:complete len:200 (+) Transcript_46842:784-1383(+)
MPEAVIIGEQYPRSVSIRHQLQQPPQVLPRWQARRLLYHGGPATHGAHRAIGIRHEGASPLDDLHELPEEGGNLLAKLFARSVPTHQAVLRGCTPLLADGLYARSEVGVLRLGSNFAGDECVQPRQLGCLSCSLLGLPDLLSFCLAARVEELAQTGRLLHRTAATGRRRLAARPRMGAVCRPPRRPIPLTGSGTCASLG